MKLPVKERRLLAQVLELEDRRARIVDARKALEPPTRFERAFLLYSDPVVLVLAILAAVSVSVCAIVS